MSIPFLSILEAAEASGLSQYFLRCGCKDGSIPHIKSGSKYYINYPAMLKQLGVPENKAAEDLKK